MTKKEKEMLISDWLNLTFACVCARVYFVSIYQSQSEQQSHNIAN